MPPIIALSLCSCIVIFLLVIERKNNPKASPALWIPTIWLMISASRPVGYWFESGLASTIEEGSTYDRIVLSALMVMALYVVAKREVDWLQALRDNLGLVLLYVFLALSIAWSDYEYISFKRWVRLVGAIPVALVVLSEDSPWDAMESIFRRCAYVLIPFSLVLIKYYPLFGVSFGRWSGIISWTGVTLTKNSLGQLCAVSAFFMLWSYLRDRKEGITEIYPARQRADLFIAALSIYLLVGIGGSFSATSAAVLAIGSAVLFLLYKAEYSRRSIAGYLLVGTVALWVLLVFSDSFAPFMKFFNRDATLTGRADIWKLGLKVASEHPILGTGFGGYWVTDNPISLAFSGYLTAHNGLLDAYIEVGIVGVCLLLWFQLGLYRRFSRGLGLNTPWAVFGICLVIMSLLYNYTESIFLKSSQYVWNITIFLALLFYNKGEFAGEDENTHSPFEPGFRNDIRLSGNIYD